MGIMSMMRDNIEFHDASIQELSFDEMDEVNGGIWPALAIVAVGGVAIVGVVLGAQFIAGVIDGASGHASQTKQ